jgi:hypothetical protein
MVRCDPNGGGNMARLVGYHVIMHRPFQMLAFLLLLTAPPALAGAGDWPQLGHDPGRTGLGDSAVAPPYQARWIWCGPAATLRNKASNAAWPDDLRSVAGADYAMPASVPFTLAGRVQPVAADGVVIVGDMDGHVYCIALDDGRPLWSGENPGGTCGSAAIAAGVAVVTSVPGAVCGFDLKTGQRRWRFETPKAITGSVLAIGDRVFIGCHDGRVYALAAADGRLLWKSEPLGAPIVADLCGDGSALYVGAENMRFVKLDPGNGRLLVQTRLTGQSFRMLHPVLHGGLLFVQTVQGPCVGSEYVMEDVMRDSPDIAAEQQNILRWLRGDTNGGRWKDASPGWKHLHVLRAADLSEPFIVPNGPADGCGSPCPPPCVDGQGRALTWFKTAFPTLTAKGSFGTKFSMDISAVDPKDGRRVPIDNGHLSGTTGETDNLFALSAAGSLLYLRQEFRGTKVIDLKTSQSHLIQAAVRTRDGGRWDADVVYRERGPLPKFSQPALAGKTAVVIAGDRLLIAEPYCVTCIEHREK